jgi:hypothetical protein
MTTTRRGKKGNNHIADRFVPVTFTMMDDPAFRKLSEAAIRVLLFSMRKAMRPDTDRFSVIFSFSYPEAKKRLMLTPGTFRRAMRQLHQIGFINYYSPGGLRCDGKAPKTYRLSLRWKKWGKPDFEFRDEGDFESIRSHYLKGSHNNTEKVALVKGAK